TSTSALKNFPASVRLTRLSFLEKRSAPPFLFQFLYLTAQWGLGDKQDIRSFSEMQLLGNGFEVQEMSQFHILKVSNLAFIGTFWHT
ncbi:MAG TPA: hypothetical protein VL832_29975, partial [Puia sp.]|nr:hypothetical protein [Puia sp.]